MNRRDVQTLVRSVRPPFLVLTPACVFLGCAFSLAGKAPVSGADVAWILIGALAAHASVNAFNEYYDFRSGLDAKTVRTPFSGGSGALPENPALAEAVFRLAVASLVLAMLVGFYFMASRSLLVLPLGLVGVAVIVTYTQWLNRYPLLCLLAPGTGFGLLMVTGTHVVLSGTVSWPVVWASLVPFFLVNNLLLLNQFPDVAADASVGRRHIPIVWGLRKSAMLYGVFALAAAAVVIAGLFAAVFPVASAICLVPLAATAFVFRGAMKHGASPSRLLPFMGIHVAVTVSVPLLLGLGILSSQAAALQIL